LAIHWKTKDDIATFHAANEPNAWVTIARTPGMASNRRHPVFGRLGHTSLGRGI